ncbi:MAG: DUF2273 domain-containing protein, partial [bacterium]
MNGGGGFEKNRARVLLALLFAAAGVLIVTVGFFKAIFIAALAAAGYFIGRVVDDRELLRRFIDTYLGK